MSKLTNTPAHLDAVAAIYADPAGVMLGQDSGASAILAKSLELRCAVRWFAALGKAPATRERNARKAFGESPVTDHVEKLAGAFIKADAMGADYEGASDQTLRNVKAGSTFYAACLAFMSADEFASVLETAGREIARSAGNVLRGTDKSGHTPLDAWVGLSNLAGQLRVMRDEKLAAKKAKASRATREPSAGASTDADADLKAIRAAFDTALDNLSQTVGQLSVSVKMPAKTRQNLTGAVNMLRDVRAMLEPSA